METRGRNLNPKKDRETPKSDLDANYGTAESNGEMVSTRGALIPAGYELYDDPRTPYICPVRDCRRTMPSFVSLGGHFGAGHKYGTFNDNGDGTLTQVGTYRNPTGSTPCIVVSRAPLSDDFPPPAEPRPPGSQLTASSANKRRLDSDSSFDMINIPKPKRKSRWVIGASSPTQPDAPVGTNLTEAVAYLTWIVHPDYRRPVRADIERMIKMPRKRDLPMAFKSHHRGTFIDVQTYACAVAYLVGTEITGSSACRQARGMFARLSERCIVPPNMSVLEVSKTHMCVGCAYLAHATDRPQQCSLVAESQTNGTATVDGASGLGRVTPPVPLPKPAPRREAPDTLPHLDDVPLASRRPVRQSVLNRLYMDKDNVGSQAQTVTTPPSTQPERVPEATVQNVQPGQFGTPDFEIEDWEIAPGRVTSEDSSRSKYLLYTIPSPWHIFITKLTCEK